MPLRYVLSVRELRKSGLRLGLIVGVLVLPMALVYAWQVTIAILRMSG